MANEPNNGSFVMDVNHHDANPANDQPRILQGMTVSPPPSPSKVTPEAFPYPSERVLQVPVPRTELENKQSTVEGKVGRYKDRIKMAPNTGRRFHEEETRLTKI